MPQVKVYNNEGKEIETIQLDEKVFGETASSALIWQVARVLRSRQRTSLAHVKDRSQVRGGGRKPWAQKGTGRARHGSIRSPLWRGGGVTFGPQAASIVKLSIPRKMVRKVLRTLVSQKVAADKLWVVDALALEKPATKSIAQLLRALSLDQKKSLFLLQDSGPVTLSVRNLPYARSIRLENINVLELLDADNVVLSRNALTALTTELKK